MSVLVEGKRIQLDREGTIRALRELADDIESGYVATFEADLELTGVGHMRRGTVEEAHPLADAFVTGNAEPVTPPTAPGRKGRK